MSENRAPAIEEPQEDPGQLARVVRQIKLNLDSPTAMAKRLGDAIEQGGIPQLQQAVQEGSAESVDLRPLRDGIAANRAAAERNAEDVAHNDERLSGVEAYSPVWGEEVPGLVMPNGMILAGPANEPLHSSDYSAVDSPVAFLDPHLEVSFPRYSGRFAIGDIPIPGDGSGNLEYSEVAAFLIPLFTRVPSLAPVAKLSGMVLVHNPDDRPYVNCTLTYSFATSYDYNGEEVFGLMVHILTRNVEEIAPTGDQLYIDWELWGHT